MMDGFDRDNPLVCEGIIGDGCGGGRIFFIQNATLFAHDPMTKEQILLLKNINMPIKLSKKKCIITIKCEKETISFDLSKIS